MALRLIEQPIGLDPQGADLADALGQLLAQGQGQLRDREIGDIGLVDVPDDRSGLAALEQKLAESALQEAIEGAEGPKDPAE